MFSLSNSLEAVSDRRYGMTGEKFRFLLFDKSAKLGAQNFDMQRFLWYLDNGAQKASWEAFETIFGDVIDTFRKFTPEINEKCVRKNRIETSSCHSVPYGNFWSIKFVFSGIEVNLYFSKVFKMDLFWCFSERTCQKFLTAIKTKCVKHWSVSFVAMPNGPRFQSLIPGVRKKDSQSLQKARKSIFWKSISLSLFWITLQPNNIRSLFGVTFSAYCGILVAFQCNCWRIKKFDKEFKLSKIGWLSPSVAEISITKFSYLYQRLNV